jgi:hypothetical protein
MTHVVSAATERLDRHDCGVHNVRNSGEPKGTFTPTKKGPRIFGLGPAARWRLEDDRVPALSEQAGARAAARARLAFAVNFVSGHALFDRLLRSEPEVRRRLSYKGI